jgi:hypothetical protein
LIGTRRIRKRERERRVLLALHYIKSRPRYIYTTRRTFHLLILLVCLYAPLLLSFRMWGSSKVETVHTL